MTSYWKPPPSIHHTNDNNGGNDGDNDKGNDKVSAHSNVYKALESLYHENGTEEIETQRQEYYQRGGERLTDGYNETLQMISPIANSNVNAQTVPFSLSTSSMTHQKLHLNSNDILPSVTFDSQEFDNHHHHYVNDDGNDGDNIHISQNERMEFNGYEYNHNDNDDNNDDDDESSTAFSLLDIDEYATTTHTHHTGGTNNIHAYDYTCTHQDGPVPQVGTTRSRSSSPNINNNNNNNNNIINNKNKENGIESIMSPSMFFQKGSFHAHGFDPVQRGGGGLIVEQHQQQQQQTRQYFPMSHTSSTTGQPIQSKPLPLQPYKMESNVLPLLPLEEQDELNKENIPPLAPASLHVKTTSASSAGASSTRSHEHVPSISLVQQLETEIKSLKSERNQLQVRLDLKHQQQQEQDQQDQQEQDNLQMSSPIPTSSTQAAAAAARPSHPSFLSPKSLERKYQVELESMRLVAEQVQQEADEKVQLAQQSCLELQSQLQTLHNGSGNDSAGGGNGKGGDKGGSKDQEQAIEMWQRGFMNLVQHLVDLEESNLYAQESTQMNQVVLSAMGQDKEHMLLSLSSSSSSSSEDVLKEYLTRLAQPRYETKNAGGLDRMDREPNSPIQVVSVATSTREFHPIPTIPTTTTRNLPSAMTVPITTTTVDQGTQTTSISSAAVSDQVLSSQLQLENASLKGSNQHMMEQVEKYRNEIKNLKEVTTRISSSNSTFSPTSFSGNHSNQGRRRRLDVDENHLVEDSSRFQEENVKLKKENEILMEGRRVVEEENLNVVQRCVALEGIAEEATQECEYLMTQFNSIQEEKKELEVELHRMRQDLDDYETNQHKKATVSQEDEEERRCNDQMRMDLSNLEQKYSQLSEQKSMLEIELEHYLKHKNMSESDAQEARNESKSLKEQLHRVEKDCAEMKRGNKADDALKALSQQVQELQKTNTSLIEEVKCIEEKELKAIASKIEFEDELCRVKNINSLTRVKMDNFKSEVQELEGVNAILTKQVSTLTSEVDDLRIVNVSLSDCKSDLQIECSQLGDRHTELQMALKKKENQLSLIDRDLAKIKDDKDRIQELITGLEGEKKISIKNLEESESRCNDLTQQNDQLISKVDNIGHKLKEAMETISSVRKQKHDDDEKLALVKSEQNILEEKMRVLEEKNLILVAKKAEDVDSLCSTLMKKSENAIKDKEDFERKYECLESDIETLRERYKQTQLELDQISVNRDELKKINQKLDHDLKLVRSKYLELENTNDSLLTDIQRLRDEYNSHISQVSKSIQKAKRNSIDPSSTPTSELPFPPLQTPQALKGVTTSSIQMKSILRDAKSSLSANQFAPLPERKSFENSLTSESMYSNIEEQLKRVKDASVRASRTLNNLHTARGETVEDEEKDDISPSLAQTEAFVLDILDSCRKPRLSFK
jgi:chromosome segregation ATPase